MILKNTYNMKKYLLVIINNLDKKILFLKKEGFILFDKKDDFKEVICEIWLTLAFVLEETFSISQDVECIVCYTNRKFWRDKNIRNTSDWIDIDTFIANGNLRWFSLSKIRTLPEKEIVIKKWKSQFSEFNKTDIDHSKHYFSRICPLLFLKESKYIPNNIDAWILEEIYTEVNECASQRFEIQEHYSRLSRSIINFIPWILTKVDTLIMHFPEGCNIWERKIDLYCSIMELFWYKFSSENSILTVTQDKRDMHEYQDYSLKFPSFSWTSTFINCVVLNSVNWVIDNISTEPEIFQHLKFIENFWYKVEFLAERKVSINKVCTVNTNIDYFIPDRNILITRIVISLLHNKEFFYQSDTNLYLTPLLTFFDAIWVRYFYDQFSIRVFSDGEIIIPSNIISGFYPKLCSDWHPLLFLLFLRSKWSIQIFDGIFEDRFRYIDEISRVISWFQLCRKEEYISVTFEWKVVEKWKSKGNIESLDLRSWAANTILLSILQSEKSVTNIEQIFRWYHNIIWDYCSVTWCNDLIYSVGGEI